MTTPTTIDFDALRKRLHQLSLFGLLAQDNAVLSEPWVEPLITIEQTERQRRSLVRRLRDAKLGIYKTLGRLRLAVAPSHRPALVQRTARRLF